MGWDFDGYESALSTNHHPNYDHSSIWVVGAARDYDETLNRRRKRSQVYVGASEVAAECLTHERNTKSRPRKASHGLAAGR